MISKKILSPGDGLEDAYAVRTQVFVDEQGFSPEIEVDDIDGLATHVVLYDGNLPVATGRVFENSDKPYEYHIGRVAVLEPYRKTGLGRELMRALESEAMRLGAETASLGSQCQARAFYEKCGYEAFGDVYYDEHCPHIHMAKALVDKACLIEYN